MSADTSRPGDPPVIRRRLGRTGIEVGSVALGTVELGLDYGFAGDERRFRPSEPDAVAFLEGAIERGIDLIDTAPAYGRAEVLVGRALAGTGPDRPFVATKLRPMPPGEPLRGTALRDHVEASLAASREALGMDRLDLVQVHSASPALLGEGEIGELLDGYRAAGVLRFTGATTYGRAGALAAIADGRFDVLQVSASVLDRELEAVALPAAAAANVGIVARSVLLRGVLTDRRRLLPAALGPLAQAAARLDAIATGAGLRHGLVELAYRYVLGQPAITTALVGTSSLAELATAQELAGLGPLEADIVERIRGVTVDPALLDPRAWPPDE